MDDTEKVLEHDAIVRVAEDYKACRTSIAGNGGCSGDRLETNLGYSASFDFTRQNPIRLSKPTTTAKTIVIA